MKRNLFPFLGIAFVVAIAATGVFYGLFVGKISGAAPAAASFPVVVVSRALDRGLVLTAADVNLAPPGPVRAEGAYSSVEDVVGRTVVKALAAGETVTRNGLAAAKGAPGLMIPKGMRAMSIRVADSMGLVPYLRSGNRVDVQSIHAQNGGDAQVRTLLNDVEVLNVYADPNPQPGPGTVVNLLVLAQDVERVALADSVAKVRIVLRSADDKDAVPVTLSSPPAAIGAARGTAAVPRVNFQVRMAAVAADTVREISTRAGLAASGEDAVRIGLLPATWKAEELKSLQVLSNDTVDSPQWQEVSVRAGGPRKSDYDLRLRLTAHGEANGMLRVRVRPELTLPLRGGLSSRGFSADLNVADGQSLLVAGFERESNAPALIEKLFRSPAPPAGSELLLVVTSRVAPGR